MQQKGCMGVVVVGNIPAGIITGGGSAVRNHPADTVFGDFPIPVDVAVNNQGAVFGKQRGETPEGMADVINILKKVEVVFFYI